MATKQSFFKLCAKLGCEVDFDRDYIGVMAPKGKVFGDYYHYSGMGVGSYGDYTKQYAYDSITDELASLRDCEDAECNEGCVQYNQNQKAQN